MQSKNFWVSWWHTENLSAFTLNTPWWFSGMRMKDNADSICAAVKAKDEAHVRRIIFSAYDIPPKDLEIRFIEEREQDWTPFNTRFMKADWMEW